MISPETTAIASNNLDEATTSSIQAALDDVHPMLYRNELHLTRFLSAGPTPPATGKPSTVEIGRYQRRLRKIRQLMAPLATPETRQKLNGRQRWVAYAGGRLPSELLDMTAQVGNRKPGFLSDDFLDDRLQNMNLLKLSIFYQDAGSVRWALQHGWDPNLYTGQSTPMGMAAYSGQANLVKLMWRHGGDPILHLQACHTEASGDAGRRLLNGSTLLHRCMARRGERAATVIEVIRFLVQIYEDPLIVNDAGLTPLDVSGSPEASMAFQEAITSRQSRCLKQRMTRGHRNNARRQPFKRL